MIEPDNEQGAALAAMMTLYVRTQDPLHGNATSVYLGGIGEMFQKFSAILRRNPSWSPIFDVDECPDEALPYLAQFVGVRPVPGDPKLRDRIRSLATFGRGRTAALLDAARLRLTGSKSVTVYERWGGDPYTVRVVTRTDETPDPAFTLRDLLAAKPAGLILEHVLATGQTFDDLDAAYSSFNDVDAAYSSFNDLLNDD